MQNASSEETIFENVAETRQAKPPGEPTNPTYSPDTKVSQLNLADGKRIGISKTLKVEQGDKLDFDIKYFFDNTQLSNDTITINDLLNSLANTFIYSLNSPSGTTAEAQQNWAASTFTGNQGLNNFLVNAFGTATINDPNKPQAFLVYLYFDDKFNFHPSESGLLQAANPNSLSDLAVLNLKIPESGYLYIYTNNESSHDVNFNNMRIHHWSGSVLEINDYYPYGYLNAELSMKGCEPLNKYKFNGKELQKDLNLEVEDFGARIYDPITAKWWQVDPLAEKHRRWTPYNFGVDNPVRFIDPDGMAPDNGGAQQIDPNQTVSYLYYGIVAAGRNLASTVSGFINSPVGSPVIYRNETTVVADENGNVGLHTEPLIQSKGGAATFGLLELGSLIPGEGPAAMLVKAPLKTEIAKDIKGLGNPFKNSSLKEVEQTFENYVTLGRMEKKGPSPETGKGAYVNIESRYSFHLDEGGEYGRGGKTIEGPHVDVNYPNPKPGNVPDKKKLEVNK